MRMSAVHSKYEEVVSEKSSAQRYGWQHVALLLRRGVCGCSPRKLKKKYLFMWHLELFEWINSSFD